MLGEPRDVHTHLGNAELSGTLTVKSIDERASGAHAGPMSEHPHPHPHADAGPVEPVPVDDVPITALLRAARGSYGHAVRRRLAAGGFDDLPGNGPYVLGGMANHGGTAGQLVRQLGVSKQAASQLVDTLVVRGYLERHPDAEDRRRLTIVLTERGRAAAAVVRAGVLEVDTALASAITPAELAGLRAGLVALCDIRDAYEERSEGHREDGTAAAA